MRFGSSELSDWLKQNGATLCLRHEDDGEVCVSIARPAKGLVKGRSVSEWGPTPDAAVELAILRWKSGTCTIKQ